MVELDERVFWTLVVIGAVAGGFIGYSQAAIGGFIVGTFAGAYLVALLPTILWWVLNVAVVVGIVWMIYSLWGVGV